MGFYYLSMEQKCSIDQLLEKDLPKKVLFFGVGRRPIIKFVL